MRYKLQFALLLSLLIHLALLLGPEIALTQRPERRLPLLVAQLKAPVLAPKPLPVPAVAAKSVEKKLPAKRRSASKPIAKPATSTPVLSVPAAVPSPLTVADPVPAVESTPEPESLSAPGLPSTPSSESAAPSASAAQSFQLPANGAIDYRVDRGDSNFAIGVARHQWEINGDHYRLTSMVQSTGIVWLFKDFRVEMESRGVITANGLQPDFFVLRRNDKETREKAFFDWQRMKVRVGDHADQDLDAGAQDFLSFNYQLGFLPGAGAGSSLPIATGRKYSRYVLESLGDEEIDIPAGHLRTLHLRAPGENTTELWLAYDYRLLPVKIRHVDSKGDSLVQVATQIEMSPP